MLINIQVTIAVGNPEEEKIRHLWSFFFYLKELHQTAP